MVAPDAEPDSIGVVRHAGDARSGALDLCITQTVRMLDFR